MAETASVPVPPSAGSRGSSELLRAAAPADGRIAVVEVREEVQRRAVVDHAAGRDHRRCLYYPAFARLFHLRISLHQSMHKVSSKVPDRLYLLRPYLMYQVLL